MESGPTDDVVRRAGALGVEGVVDGEEQFGADALFESGTDAVRVELRPRVRLVRPQVEEAVEPGRDPVGEVRRAVGAVGEVDHPERTGGAVLAERDRRLDVVTRAAGPGE